MLYLAVPSPVCALVILALTQTVSPIWRRALILSVSALETCTVPSTEWIWSRHLLNECFSQQQYMVNNIHIIVPFLQMDSMKTRFGDFLELGCKPGACSSGHSALWMRPRCSFYPLWSSGQVSPHTHLTNLFCSQSLIDFPLSFLRAGTGSCSFLLYLSQSKQFFLPSKVILNLHLNDKC